VKTQACIGRFGKFAGCLALLLITATPATSWAWYPYGHYGYYGYLGGYNYGSVVVDFSARVSTDGLGVSLEDRTFSNPPPFFDSGLLTGGGFESPVATAALYLDGQSPAGWTNTGVGGPVDIISAGYFGAAADSDNQFVDLIGGGEGVLPAGITQTVQLLAGQLYEFKFAYNGGGNPTPGVAEVLEYSVGDLVTGTIDTSALQVYPNLGTATPWHQFSAQFTPTQSGAYPVTFKTSAGSFAGPFVDSVRLAAVVPEPSTFVLAGVAGFFALALCWRRR
jgi:PEP-CTERM motif